MDTITQTFYSTFTLQWLLVAIPLALVLSMVVSRIVAAPVLALFAVAIQHLAPVIWPLVMQGAPTSTMSTLASATLLKVAPLVAGMEFIAFTFFIAVLSLTRRDMFRTKPDA